MDKLVTANTTVQSSVISQPTSSAEFVEMLGIWPGTVLTDSAEQTGATMHLVQYLVHDQLDGSVLEMLLIGNMRRVDFPNSYLHKLTPK